MKIAPQSADCSEGLSPNGASATSTRIGPRPGGFPAGAVVDWISVRIAPATCAWAGSAGAGNERIHPRGRG